MFKRIGWLLVGCFLGCLSPLSGGEIHEAAKSGDVARVRALMDQDPGLLTAFDEQGKTPLHWATGRGQLEVMKLLLDAYHADVDCKNVNDGTPLHVAASQAQSEAARLLIDRGAKLDATRAADGMTPLHIAALKGRKPGHLEVARLLLAGGADVNARMKNGATPLVLATFRGNTQMVELLRRSGAVSGAGRDRGRGVGRGRPEARLVLPARREK